MRCDWPYSLKPLRQRACARVNYAFSSAHALSLVRAARSRENRGFSRLGAVSTPQPEKLAEFFG